MTKCLNCDNEFEGKFCNNCGQKASVERLRFKKIWPELRYSLFHFDNGIYNNIKGIFSPRKTTFSYIQGKRKSFLNPFLYALIFLGLLTIMPVSSFDFHFNVNTDEYGTFDAGKYVIEFSKYFLFLSVFMMAFANRIVYGKSHKTNITEHFYIGAFLVGNTAVVSCILNPMDYIFKIPFSGIGFIVVVWIFLYFNFRKRGFFIDILKSLLALIIGFIFYASLIGVIMISIAFIDFQLF